MAAIKEIHREDDGSITVTLTEERQVRVPREKVITFSQEDLRDYIANSSYAASVSSSAKTLAREKKEDRVKRR